MESFKIENLSFAYMDRVSNALNNINITINMGEFVTICGKSGCGKTTLLRLLKPSLSPYGKIVGDIYFEGKLLSQCDTKEQTSKIGFVMQSPENQIVTDRVWHELAFGLESLGYSTSEIRTRVSEMASFFGIQTWFHKKVSELSGGQKQILNLASVMVMQPSVLILDEPTSQLDPIAAQEFLKTLEKVNRELGTSVVMTEHRLEEAFAMSDRVIVIDEGRVIADASPREVGEILKNIEHDMYFALPAPMRVYAQVQNSLECPLTVRDGRIWLENYSENNKLKPEFIPKTTNCDENQDVAIEIKDAWFRYEREMPDVIKGLNLTVMKGELFAVLGGNGTGKTTALSLISGINKPYRGKLFITGKSISQIKDLHKGILGVLPQNPQSLFSQKTVYLDLEEMLSERKLQIKEIDEQVFTVAKMCHIENLLESHPYDLSGGEQQRAALAKILLQSPQILLLDEPTKGMDAHFKGEFADILRSLKTNGVTIVMVSHDIEFCAEYADKCAMFFDGSISSTGTPREFFKGKSFYTTSANRMARTKLPDAVLVDDIVLACGGEIKKKDKHNCNYKQKNYKSELNTPKKESRRISAKRIILGSIFALLFVVTTLLSISNIDILSFSNVSFMGFTTLQIISLFEIVVAIFAFFPQKDIGIKVVQAPKADGNRKRRNLLITILMLILIPLTIYMGYFFFGNRKYYFISLLIILETIVPFCLLYESRKPKARELVLISVFCAMAVAGRVAFFMLPQFKPVVALVIIAGVCFGGETGFLIGAITGFVSNFFFGQGPWTPWQMFAYGIIGFITGILFRSGLIRKTKASLCLFGFLVTLVVYGGIMNPASVIMWQNKITWEMIFSSYILGLTFDLIHSVGTAFFLWFISEPMIDIVERIKVKYGLVE
ncbi:MAG: ATP-binding cassette domain-containing protein [Eubacteriales bacterium]|nr:ATP-binding cassette domain-containing protein [Eubacteriales bacterium]